MEYVDDCRMGTILSNQILMIQQTLTSYTLIGPCTILQFRHPDR
jgi:hypothetical protein